MVPRDGEQREVMQAILRSKSVLKVSLRSHESVSTSPMPSMPNQSSKIFLKIRPSGS
jgi:hypothetical protein